jgi:hypothetical protein
LIRIKRIRRRGENADDRDDDDELDQRKAVLTAVLGRHIPESKSRCHMRLTRSSEAVTRRQTPCPAITAYCRQPRYP